jgi:uncharacterized protein YceH (UPF0502 family)
MPEAVPPRWQPIPAIERRVLGVLAEKAKTTPDAYPMTLNAICVGANQKSNRHPLMNLEPDDVQAALDRLRELGAAAEIIGGGRAAKFRHHFYEWLGVDKAESAVMIELLLRGAQTEGELRGRAARMEPIADVAALRPVLESLKAKGLLVSLTSAGRGHVVTHALYEPREMEKLRAEYSIPSTQYLESDGGTHCAADEDVSPRPTPPPMRASSDELAALRSELAELRRDLEDLASKCSTQHHELEQLKSQLGV